MSAGNKRATRLATGLFFSLTLVTLLSTSALAGGYDNALKGVNNYNAVFEVSQGDPKVNNIVFWAVKNAYEADEVNKLSGAHNITIVFHGPVVKLLSSDRSPFNDSDWAEVEKFQATLRQMKKDGVKLEVCLYAVKVMGVDKATIMPEIAQVDNGFVSVIGYQMQGYGVVRIP
jgi:intracellular sulfur oxidation DsrE/DsrF family protein